MATASIRTFRPGDQPAFEKLNVTWIETYFSLEAKDLSVLGEPELYILGRGGEILVAEIEGEIVGCCALTPIEGESVELSKMAVSLEHQGQGIGEALVREAIQHSRGQGFKRLYLETSHRLPAAIRLYKKCGFVEVPPERIVPSVFVRADVYLELWL